MFSGFADGIVGDALMRWLAILLVCVFAFLVILKGGHRIALPEAVGFAVVDREYVEGSEAQAVVVFFDREMKPLQAIPLDMIGGAVWIPDGGMM